MAHHNSQSSNLIQRSLHALPIEFDRYFPEARLNTRRAIQRQTEDVKCSFLPPLLRGTPFILWYFVCSFFPSLLFAFYCETSQYVSLYSCELASIALP